MRKYISAALICVSLFLSSCNDWLAEDPKTQVPVDRMFEDAQGFMDALTDCYIKMNSTSLWGRQLSMVEIEYLAQLWELNSYTSSADVTSFKNFDYTTGYAENFRTTVFNSMYNIIAQANIVLENIASRGQNIKSEQLRAVIEAEARAIRAFAHMEVLRLFGQVPRNATITVTLPYVESVDVDPVVYYSFNDFVSKVMHDLGEAERLLGEFDPLVITMAEGSDDTYDFSTDYPDEDFLSFRRFRFNYYAVLAIEARLHMYLGDADKAAEYAGLVISSGKLELAGETDYQAGNYAMPSECILALSNSNLEKLNEALVGTSTYNFMSTTRLADLFAGVTTSNRFVSGWNTTYKNQQLRDTPVIRKYIQPAQGSATLIELSIQKQVIPLARLSEMYLIMMEAAADMGMFNEYYDPYMRARGIGPAQAPALTLDTKQQFIIDEYRREFFAEGQMFYVYKRLGATQMKWRTPAVAEQNYVLPLPRNEIGEVEIEETE